MHKNSYQSVQRMIKMHHNILRLYNWKEHFTKNHPYTNFHQSSWQNHVLQFTVSNCSIILRKFNHNPAKKHNFESEQKICYIFSQCCYQRNFIFVHTYKGTQIHRLYLDLHTSTQRITEKHFQQHFSLQFPGLLKISPLGALFTNSCLNYN